MFQQRQHYLLLHPHRCYLVFPNFLQHLMFLQPLPFRHYLQHHCFQLFLRFQNCLELQILKL
jgi:hypothetical protein